MAVQAEHQTQIGMPLDEFIRQYDDAPFELVNGERIPLMPPVAIHVFVLKIIYNLLVKYEETTGVGVAFSEAPFVRLDQSQWVKGSRVPDALFYSAERWKAYTEATPDYFNKPFVLIPDLCVEVISENDVYLDVEDKVKGYLQDGVRLVWVFNPRQKDITVRTSESVKILTADDTLDGGVVLPGFTAPVRTLFPE